MPTHWSAIPTRAGLVVALATLLAACPKPSPQPREPPRPRLASDKPLDLSLQSLNGKEIRLSQFRGRPLVLFFFTTWCVPCQVQLARIQPVRAALGNDKVAVLGISLDTERRLVAPFVEAAGINFPVAFGEPGWVRGGPLGAVRGVPRLLVLDAKGRPVADRHRPVDARPLLRILKPLVR